MNASDLPEPRNRKVSDALFSGFVRLPSNASACESALALVEGRSKFVMLSGPSGWGKTHLLRNISTCLAAQADQPVPIECCPTWIEKPTGADSPRPLLLEHAQVVGTSTRVRQRLRQIIERRMRGGKPTVLTISHERMGRFFPLLLPGGSHWKAANLRTPAPAEKIVMVHQLSHGSGLLLPPPLVSFVARRAGRTGATIMGALQRLTLVHMDWRDPLVALKAVGVLQPLLSEEGGWDVRDHTFEALAPHLDSLKPQQREEFCIYVMHHLQALPEDQVACYFGRAPGQIYRIAKQGCKRVQGGEWTEMVARCEKALLDSFFLT